MGVKIFRYQKQLLPHYKPKNNYCKKVNSWNWKREGIERNCPDQRGNERQFFGNIIFGEPEGIFGRNDEPFSFFNRSGMSFKEDQYAFLSVENMNEIIPVFGELGLKVTKTFY